MNICQKCSFGELIIDDVEGFLLCPECGYVADDCPLLQQPHNAGTTVRHGDTGAGAGRLLLPQQGEGGVQYGTGGFAQAVASQTRAIQLAQNRVRTLATTLEFGHRTTQEACTLVKQVYTNGAVHIGGSAKTVDALCAAALLAVGRSNAAPVSLADVCHAAQTDKRATGSFYRALHDAGLLASTPAGNTLPSQSLRAFTLRFAAGVLKQQQSPKSEQRAPPLPLKADRTPQSVVSHTAVIEQVQGEPLAETDIRAHPFVKAALALAELVSRARIGEGRPPAVMAGAVTVLQSEASGMGPVSGADIQSMAGMARCNKRTLSAAVACIKDQLLQLAALLPLGPLVNKDNVIMYLNLIVTATHTIVRLKASEKQGIAQLGVEGSAQEPEPRMDAEDAAAVNPSFSTARLDIALPESTPDGTEDSETDSSGSRSCGPATKARNAGLQATAVPTELKSASHGKRKRHGE